MTVRTAYPSLFAEVADALGLGRFQRVVDIEIHGASCNEAALSKVAAFSKLQKLTVSPLADCTAQLAAFERLRPDVQVHCLAATGLPATISRAE